jgi:hypothetical protein
MEAHIYQTRGSKVIDFLIGFFLVAGVFEYALKLLLKRTGYTDLTGWMLGAAFAGLALSVFLYQKRRYMGIGFISVMGFHALAVSPYLLLLVLR